MGLAAVKEHREDRPTWPSVPALIVAWAAWIITRSLMVFISFRFNEHWGDVEYYYREISDASGGEYALKEYPALSSGVLELIFASVDSLPRFAAATIAILLVCDLLFSSWFVAKRKWSGYAFWLLFGVALAPLAVSRLDGLTGISIAVAAILIGKPLGAAACLALATALKLWPISLAAGLVRQWKFRDSWLSSLGFLFTLAALTTLVVSWQGWGRVVSPLRYQGDRGLQSEALLATPFVWLASWKQDWEVIYASSASFEVKGPGVFQALMLTDIGTVCVALFCLSFGIYQLLYAPRVDKALVRQFWIVASLLVISTAKVFSPQYLLWIGPLVAVSLALDGQFSVVYRRLLWALIPVGVLTTVFYPVLFDSFAAPSAPGALAVLTCRNLLLALLTAWLSLDLYNNWRRVRFEKLVDQHVRSPSALA